MSNNERLHVFVSVHVNRKLETNCLGFENIQYLITTQQRDPQEKMGADAP